MKEGRKAIKQAISCGRQLVSLLEYGRCGSRYGSRCGDSRSCEVGPGNVELLQKPNRRVEGWTSDEKTLRWGQAGWKETTSRLRCKWGILSCLSCKDKRKGGTGETKVMLFAREPLRPGRGEGFKVSRDSRF